LFVSGIWTANKLYFTLSRKKTWPVFEVKSKTQIFINFLYVLQAHFVIFNDTIQICSLLFLIKRRRHMTHMAMTATQIVPLQHTSKAQHGTAQHGITRHSTARHYTTQHSTALHDTAQHTAHSTAHGITRHSTQHSPRHYATQHTAHSTALHDTAHSTQHTAHSTQHTAHSTHVSQ
jgi:hypothetical protein